MPERSGGWLSHAAGGRTGQRPPRPIPYSTWRLLRTGGFRSSDLNGVGWLAVLGPGVVAGLVRSRRSSVAVLPSLLHGAAVSWILALGLDHRAWRDISFGYSTSDLDRVEARLIVDHLRASGIDVTIEDRPDPDEESAWSVRSTNRHRRAVLAALEAGRGGT